MSAKAARRTRQQGATANGQQHVNQASREALRRGNERLRQENEELRRKVADGEKQIADGKKQIVELERKLAGRRKNSTNSSKPPSSDGTAGLPRPPGRKRKSKLRRAPKLTRYVEHNIAGLMLSSGLC